MGTEQQSRESFSRMLQELFVADAPIKRVETNLYSLSRPADAAEQSQTTTVFSEKWERYGESAERPRLYEMQRRWFLDLYGFADEPDLVSFLRRQSVIIDAGCGLGYKSEWFAKHAPDALVLGVDSSTAVVAAADAYRDTPNLFFLEGDIAQLPLRSGSASFVVCDQVIMHTQDPDATFAELARVMEPGAGQIACYFYAKKALPRELLDDYFRRQCQNMTTDELWEMSEQLTLLGRRLSELGVEIDVPAIPALGLNGGVMDIQRFIYWNFIKCFWNEDLGHETSVITNFDWYSPSNARRYSEAEVRALVHAYGLHAIHFHSEEACYSGRFGKAD